MQGSKNPEELLENLKLELFSEEVFVFTPKGDLVVLPKGATPVDFAYHIHTDIGNHCAGAKVNGRIVPLNYRLQNGDMVEIITNPNKKPMKHITQAINVYNILYLFLWLFLLSFSK